MRIALMALALAPLGLAACSPPAPAHDKAYFAVHAQERAETLGQCRNDPGRLGRTPNCASALQADADAEHQRVFHSTPPPAPGVNNASHL